MKNIMILAIIPMITASSMVTNCTMNIQICPYDSDVLLSFNHPTALEDGTALDKSKIAGYEIRTVLKSGQKSMWVMAFVPNDVQ